MKTITLALVGVIAIVSLQLSQALSDSEAMAVTQKFVDECIKDVGLTANDAKLIKDDKFAEVDTIPFSDKMKCFLPCFYKKLGILDANAKVNKDMLAKFMEARYEDKKDKVRPAFSKCESLTDKNPCEAVYKFEMCLAQSMKA